jgi:TRAP-type C4-dicarboxylate transport system permease small subunit
MTRPGAALRRCLGSLEEVVAGLGFVAVVAITLYNVVNRYVFRQSGVWAPELAGVIFAWVVFLGASAAWKHHMHVSIDVVVTRLDRRARRATRILAKSVMVVFLAYTTWLAAKITVSSYLRETPVLRIPFSYIYVSAALGFALMAARSLMDLVKELRGQTDEAAEASPASLPF